MRSRRILGFGVVFSMLLTAVATVALAAGVTSAEDDFSSGGYSGGTGWTGNWTEFGDDNDPDAGAVLISGSNCNGNRCGRITTTGAGDHGLGRNVNLEGAASALLSFTYRRRVLLAAGTFQVQVRSETESWTTVKTYGLLGSDSSHVSSGAVNIHGKASSSTQIRFLVTGISLNSEVYIDNVEITATYPATTTSTTTTSTTTTTTPASTTTTRPPIVTVPSLPIITVPTLPTTTSTTTTVAGEPRPTTTTAPSSTSTTTSTASGSDSGQPPDRGDGGEPRRDTSENSGTIPPLSTAELSVARDNNIAVDLANGDDFKAFGVSPLTGLSVGLSSKVEVISTSVMSALALGGLIAFFAVRQKREDEDPRS